MSHTLPPPLPPLNRDLAGIHKAGKSFHYYPFTIHTSIGHKSRIKTVCILTTWDISQMILQFTKLLIWNLNAIKSCSEIMAFINMRLFMNEWADIWQLKWNAKRQFSRVKLYNFRVNCSLQGNSIQPAIKTPLFIQKRC